MKKEKKEILQWSQLPTELKTYFLLRFLGVVVGSLGILVLGLVTSTLHLLSYIIYVLLGFGIFTFFHFYQVSTNKYLVYIGTCEKKHAPIHSIGAKKTWWSMYGKSYLLVRIDGELFNVPVGNSYGAETGDTIVFYANPKEIYQKKDNTWVVADTLVVKTIKK